MRTACGFYLISAYQFLKWLCMFLNVFREFCSCVTVWYVLMVRANLSLWFIGFSLQLCMIFRPCCRCCHYAVGVLSVRKSFLWPSRRDSSVRFKRGDMWVCLLFMPCKQWASCENVSSALRALYVGAPTITQNVPCQSPNNEHDTDTQVLLLK